MSATNKKTLLHRPCEPRIGRFIVKESARAVKQPSQLVNVEIASPDLRLGSQRPGVDDFVTFGIIQVYKQPILPLKTPWVYPLFCRRDCSANLKYTRRLRNKVME